MKATESFNEIIREHLEQAAASDPLFAKSYGKGGKTLENCVLYILNQVKSSGRSGFSDAEIFGMAKHYYDEDDPTNGKTLAKIDNVRIVTNQFSDKERENLKKEARERLIKQEMDRLSKKPTRTKQQIDSPSLFDL